MDHQSWYERTYPELNGAGLWLRGGELNTLPSGAWDERAFRVLFARLSTYRDTADSFTHGLLYQLAAGVPGVFPDLAYLPPLGDLPRFRRDRVPWLLGTQSKRGPEDFQLIGFSLSVAQELLNLPSMVRESGLPLAKSERLRRPEVPLLILGGSSALYSSIAWGDEPWVDAVFVGESALAIRRLLEILRDGAAAGLGKRALLDALAGVPGLFEPDRLMPSARGPGMTVRRAACTDLDAEPTLERAPVPFLRDRIGVAQLQLSQGCPCFCSFCAESWDRKPYRERSLTRLLELARRLKAGMAAESLELFSASANAHRHLQALLEELAPEFGRLRLKSQRFDQLAHEPAQVEVLHALAKTSLTCGLEGISPRLRRYLHKSLPEEDLQRALDLILSSRARELKVFLIATGLEEDEDFAAFEELLGRLSRLRQRLGAGTRCIFSITPLVRFPWTPLELEAAPPPVACERIVRRAARAVQAAGFEFREAADLAEYWVAQLLVRADRPSIGTALLRALEETGFLYYRRVDPGFVATFQARLAEAGLEAGELFRASTPAEAAARPWARIETGVRREHLWEALEQARAFVDEGYCFGRPWLRARCAQCGACSPEEVAAMVTTPPPRPAPAAERLRERLRRARQAEREVRFRIEAGPATRGVPRRTLSAAFLQALLDHSPPLAAGFRRYGVAHFEGDGEPVWLEGAEVLRLAFDAGSLDRLTALASDPAAREAVDHRLGAWGRWLGLAPEGWAPRELRARAPFPFEPDAYLGSLGLKFTRLRAGGPGAYRLELSPLARRKGLLLELAWKQTEDGSEVQLRPGPKLHLEELLRHTFRLPSPEQWVRVRARVIGP